MPPPVHRLLKTQPTRVICSFFLNMRVHTGKVASIFFYHLRHLRQLRYVLTPSPVQRLVCALILSRLDYCNSVLAGLPAVTLVPLQRVIHAAVRLVAIPGFRDSVTASMKTLHWLPIPRRIKYKLSHDEHGCSWPKFSQHQ